MTTLIPNQTSTKGNGMRVMRKLTATALVTNNSCLRAPAFRTWLLTLVASDLTTKMPSFLSEPINYCTQNEKKQHLKVNNKNLNKKQFENFEERKGKKFKKRT